MSSTKSSEPLSKMALLYSMSLRFYTRLLTFPREQLYKGWQFSHPSHPVSMPSIPPPFPPFLTVSPSVCESVFQSCGESGSLSATSSLTFTLHLFSLLHHPLFFPLHSLFSSLVHFLAVSIQLTSPASLFFVPNSPTPSP